MSCWLLGWVKLCGTEALREDRSELRESRLLAHGPSLALGGAAKHHALRLCGSKARLAPRISQGSGMHARHVRSSAISHPGSFS